MISISRRWILTCILICVTLSLVFNLLERDEWTPPPPPPPTEDSPLPPDFSWKTLPRQWPLDSSMIPLPNGPPAQIPPIQHKFAKETPVERFKRQKRLAAVKNSFKHSWNGYKKNAWLQDEVRPLSGGYKNGFGGWGATLVDSLDTLWIMDMKKEFETAVAALRHLDFTVSPSPTISVFETTIRYVGGLLSAYDLSNGKHPILLEKAIELGDMLYASFDTANNMPVVGSWNWLKAAKGDLQSAPSNALSADIGSLSLEFTRLSQLSGDPKYYDAIQRIMNAFEESQNSTRLPGMWPVSLNARKLDFTNDRVFTLGAMADSLYEYFPKQYLLLNGRDKQTQHMYEKSIAVAKEHLFYRPLNPGNLDLLISGSVRQIGASYDRKHEGQHLTCFVGGMVALGAKIFNTPEDIRTAQQLTDGCVWAYQQTPSGMMPEIFEAIPCTDDEDCKWTEERWYKGLVMAVHRVIDTSTRSLKEQAQQIIERGRLPLGFAKVVDSRYYLRPEAIESVFYMYRITGDKAWQDKAWQMFQAIDSHAKTDIAYAVVQDVRDTQSQLTDTMESFWTGETLKYFYLIFSEPDLINLDSWVLNTEAHPLRRPQN
ncbi:seven-hairpin glycosidase, partial [Aureobasidium melanogenum]